MSEGLLQTDEDMVHDGEAKVLRLPAILRHCERDFDLECRRPAQIKIYLYYHYAFNSFLRVVLSGFSYKGGKESAYWQVTIM